MKKYFKITNDEFLKVYEKYEQDYDSFNEAFDTMQKEFELESNRFYVTVERFGIAYNDKDHKRYKDQYMKNDLEFFKKNSTISKRWLELMKEKNITTSRKPFCGNYMKTRSMGKSTYNSHRLFGEVYGFLDADYSFELGDGFEEIKASEYYALIEKHDEQIKKVD